MLILCIGCFIGLLSCYFIHVSLVCFVLVLEVMSMSKPHHCRQPSEHDVIHVDLYVVSMCTPLIWLCG